MTVGIVGLGLIGGSFAKAYHEAGATVLAWNRSRSVRSAGDAMDACIVSHMRRVYNLLIGERTAESIKMTIGSAFPTGQEKTMEVRGRDIVAGLPKTMTISSEEIRDSLTEPVSNIVEAVRTTLGNCEPELAAAVCTDCRAT